MVGILPSKGLYEANLRKVLSKCKKKMPSTRKKFPTPRSRGGMIAVKSTKIGD
jgi:hypothetical protein